MTDTPKKRRLEPEMNRGPYKVGRGKPPKHTQWKPGQSGNPSGRSKSVEEPYGDLIDRIGKEVIAARCSGKILSMTKSRALARTVVDRGIAGDPACEDILIRIEASDLSARTTWRHMIDIDHEDEIPARQQEIIESYRKHPVGVSKPQDSGDRGRSKGDVSFAELVKQELKKPIEVQLDDGKTVTITKREAWIRRVYNGAINGDPRCLKTYIKIAKPTERPGHKHDFFFIIGGK